MFCKLHARERFPVFSDSGPPIIDQQAAPRHCFASPH
jgi:hypothetical protein